MITEQDIDILAAVGKFAWNTPNALKEVLHNGRFLISINIKDDIMQECIDFVKENIKEANEDRIISIINNDKLRDDINKFECKLDIDSLYC